MEYSNHPQIRSLKDDRLIYSFRACHANIKQVNETIKKEQKDKQTSRQDLP